MMKLTDNPDLVRSLDQPVAVEGYETIPANATIHKKHRLWKTYQAWLDQGNEPEPVETEDQRKKRLAQEIRSKRDQLLKESDWTQLRDVPVNKEWKAYRKQLRDITKQKGFPEQVKWPEEPK